MCRRLFTILAAVSTVLCVATCALWVRSYYVIDAVVAGDGSRYWHTLIADRGTLAVGWCYSDGFYHTDVVPATLPYEPLKRYKLPSRWFARHRIYQLGSGNLYINLARKWQVLGIARSFHGGKQYLLVPLWVAVIVSLVLPISWLRGCRRVTGTWCTCGYDLRATPNQCPECGTVPIKSTSV